MVIIKALAKTIAFLAVFYVGLRYLGGFSMQQSAALAAVGMLGYALYSNLNVLMQAEGAFTPFCVSIRPNWYQLLSDFKLVTSPEEWQRLCEEEEKVPASQYNVFRSGIIFTVIRPPSNGLLPGLTYWDNRKCFLTDVEPSESIMPIDGYGLGGLGKQHPFLQHPQWAQLPGVYFKLAFGGYELGLEVQDDWWENLCKSGTMGELAKVKQHRDHLCGTTRLVIATLPLSEFGTYYRNVDYGQMNKLRESMNKQLEANGWKRKDERDPEIRDPWSHIEHKYFAISVRAV
jgi:hypothetical protein